MLIQDQGLGLFPFNEAESEQYLTWVNDEEHSRLLGRALPVTDLEHQNWYRSIIQSSSSVVFAIKTLPKEEYLGNVWLHGIHWVNRNAELRILLGATDYQGKGYGTQSCRLLLKYAFEKLGLKKVYLYVSSLNPRAEKAFQKAGFREEGHLKSEFFIDGQFVDVKRMAVLAHEF